MTFFEGLQFVSSGIRPGYRLFSTRLFPDAYGLQYSQDGSFRVEAGRTFRKTVNGPWLLITRPGVPYRYGAPPGGRRLHAFVCFRGSRVERYLQSGLMPPDTGNPLLRITRPERFLAAMEQLVSMLQPLSSASTDRAVHALEGVLLQLHEQTPDTTTIPLHLRQQFAELIAAIRADPVGPRNFRGCAAEMHLSYTHFRRLFQKFTGHAPTRFVTRTRLLRAAKLLEADPERPIKRIAADNGYEDCLYFSRLFARHYRVSPRQYRRAFFDDPGGRPLRRDL